MGRKRKKTPRRFRHLSRDERMKIEAWYNINMPVKEIAAKLGRSKNTIYLELRRGKTTQRDHHYKERIIYSCDKGQYDYDKKQANKGMDSKLALRYDFIDAVEDLIIKKKMSPAAARAVVLKREEFQDFSICLTTIYNWIKKGIFPNVTYKHLPVRRKQKKGKVCKKKEGKRLPRGESIENRDPVVDKREEFGHWEMDTVYGSTTHTLLVLTERKTRAEVIYKMPNRKAESVRKAIDDLERKYEDRFAKVFKSITVDNGSEFKHWNELEKSVIDKENRRTKIYYCHSYCSSERGSNEVQNKLVRRHYPKGSSFATMKGKDVIWLEEWINHYPRRMFGYRTSAELFQEELEKIV